MRRKQADKAVRAPEEFSRRTMIPRDCSANGPGPDAPAKTGGMGEQIRHGNFFVVFWTDLRLNFSNAPQLLHLPAAGRGHARAVSKILWPPKRLRANELRVSVVDCGSPLPLCVARLPVKKRQRAAAVHDADAQFVRPKPPWWPQNF